MEKCMKEGRKKGREGKREVKHAMYLAHLVQPEDVMVDGQWSVQAPSRAQRDWYVPEAWAAGNSTSPEVWLCRQ